jgi:hypothetical protein
MQAMVMVLVLGLMATTTARSDDKVVKIDSGTIEEAQS